MATQPSFFIFEIGLGKIMQSGGAGYAVLLFLSAPQEEVGDKLFLFGVAIIETGDQPQRRRSQQEPDNQRKRQPFHWMPPPVSSAWTMPDQEFVPRHNIIHKIQIFRR